ncbi:MAG: YfiT family bacillithiol transferase [Acidobacteriota bacterium]
MEDLRFPVGDFAPPSEFNHAVRGELISQIDETPAALRGAVHRLTAEQLQTPYREGGWTLAQVVHHLPDSHANAYVRFRLALTESEPTVKPYNEAKWAELTDAASSDIESSLLMLEGIHQRWVSLLRRLTPEQWTTGFYHPERGRVTLENTLALYAWHGRHHVAHINGLRSRMGW